MFVVENGGGIEGDRIGIEKGVFSYWVTTERAMEKRKVIISFVTFVQTRGLDHSSVPFIGSVVDPR